MLENISLLEKSLYHEWCDKTFADLKETRNKLYHLYDLKLKGIMVRCRAKWIEPGTNTMYFLNLEKRNNVIRCISRDDGVIVTSRKSIRYGKMSYKLHILPRMLTQVTSLMILY